MSVCPSSVCVVLITELIDFKECGTNTIPLEVIPHNVLQLMKDGSYANFGGGNRATSIHYIIGK
jgi:hypothetical protein